MPSAHNILATAATTAALLLAASVPSAVGASARPATKLTKATVAAAALRDARAAATISGGDKVIVSNCRPYGRSAFKCAIQLVPQTSGSRCRWTDTITLVKAKPSITYSRVVCSG